MKKTVLIVDDHDGFRRAVKAFLEQQKINLEIFEADSERSAVKMAAKEKPAIVLLELQLPKMNGIKTSKLIKEVSPASKIVIVSMFDAEKFQKNFMAEHIDEVVGKSEFDRKLVRILKKYLREEKGGKETGKDAGVSRTPLGRRRNKSDRCCHP